MYMRFQVVGCCSDRIRCALVMTETGVPCPFALTFTRPDLTTEKVSDI
jgi:hypothetical protein